MVVLMYKLYFYSGGLMPEAANGIVLLTRTALGQLEGTVGDSLTEAFEEQSMTCT
jgi:hypothetical protein